MLASLPHAARWPDAIFCNPSATDFCTSVSVPVMAFRSFSVRRMFSVPRGIAGFFPFLRISGCTTPPTIR